MNKNINDIKQFMTPEGQLFVEENQQVIDGLMDALIRIAKDRNKYGFILITSMITSALIETKKELDRLDYLEENAGGNA